jgi:hypothetical protein
MIATCNLDIMLGAFVFHKIFCNFKKYIYIAHLSSQEIFILNILFGFMILKTSIHNNIVNIRSMPIRQLKRLEHQC